MAEKIISASLKVNTGTSVQDINAVNKSLDQTSAELNQTDKDAKQSTSSFTNLKGALEKVPGPLGAVNQGVNTVSTSLKALAANPIVLVVTLLVAALVALYKAFTSTEAGAEKVEQIFSGLGAIVTVIRDRILALAGAVISFFKGDFKQAIEQTKAAVSGVGDAIVDAYNRAADATRRLQEAQDDLTRRIEVNRANLNRDLAKSKELISDETASYKERTQAINEVEAAQKKQAADEVANAKEMLSIAEERYNLDKQSSDAADELAKARINVANVEQQAAADERAINKQRTAIEAQELAKRNEQNKAFHDAEMQRIAERKKAEEDAFNSRLNAQKMNQDFIDSEVERRAKEREDQKKQDEQDQKDRDEFQKNIDAKEAAEVQKHIKLYNDQAEAEKKIDENRKKGKEAFVGAMSALLQNAANLFGKSTAAGKVLAVAGTTIDTFRSAQAAFTGMVTTFPGPWGIAAGIAAAAAAVAGGIANVKNILAVKVPGGDAGTASIASVSTTTPSAPVAPVQQGTTLDQTSIQNIGDASKGRAYVLSQDVTHDQDRNERLNRAARLGG